MADFLAMGGYATYVWGAYAAFLLVLGIDALAPLAERRRIVSTLRGRFRRRQSRNRPQP